MYDKCRGQHSCCDVCDGMRHDPDTGWGGFTDHYTGKHFNTEEEQKHHYDEARRRGETGERNEE